MPRVPPTNCLFEAGRGGDDMAQSRESEGIVRGMDDPRLLDALEANTYAAYASYAVDSGGEQIAAPDRLTYIAGIPFELFNGVARARLAPDDSDDLDAQITAALQPFIMRGHPMFWWTGPSSAPKDLGARLVEHGLVDDGSMPGMAIALSDLRQTHEAPARLVTEQVNSPRLVEEFTLALRAGYGVPEEMQAPLAALGERQALSPDSPWLYFVGRLDGEPVSTVQLFLHAGVAGVYAVSTAPAARRQGIGEALTHAALLAARERGYAVGILQSSAMGLHIYERLGFRALTSFHLYLWRGE